MPKRVDADELRKEIRLGKKRFAVHGIGFVGTAITAVWLRVGAKVIAVDTDPLVVRAISRGKSLIHEPGSEEAFSKGVKDGKLTSTSDGVWAAKHAEISIVSVPVGLTADGADLSHLESAVGAIASGVRKGDAVIVSPTVPIGTSANLVRMIEERSRLKVEADFYYIYSPERISEGQAIADIERNYPAIVAGAGPKSLEFAKELFSIIARGVIALSSTSAAEAEKLFEGVYRDVNIALANEFGKVCERIGVDFWEVREAANSQPYSHIHKTGIGVGGACIPVYPQILVKTAREKGVELNVTSAARGVNLGMPSNSVRRALEMIKKDGDFSGSKVAVLGLSFRGDVQDRRLSPTYDIVKELRGHHLEVAVHDPYFDSDERLGGDAVLSQELDVVLKGADLVILSTDHGHYKRLNEDDLKRMTGKSPAVYDGRGLWKREAFQSLQFAQIGRP